MSKSERFALRLSGPLQRVVWVGVAARHDLQLLPRDSRSADAVPETLNVNHWPETMVEECWILGWDYWDFNYCICIPFFVSGEWPLASIPAWPRWLTGMQMGWNQVPRTNWHMNQHIIYNYIINYNYIYIRIYIYIYTYIYMAQRLVVPLPPPKWWWSLMCKLCIYIYTHMCVYTYVICVCANVYSMYMYVYLHMSMYPSPRGCGGGGLGGPWTRDTGPYIYIYTTLDSS